MSDLLSKSISIFIADDHMVVREGLMGLLRHQPDFCVIGDAADGLLALEAVSTLKPDILLLDLSIPKLHGFHVLSGLRKEKKPRVVVLTMHSDTGAVLECFRQGARGFVHKGRGIQHVVEAIRTVANGGVWTHPEFHPLLRRAAIEGGTSLLTIREQTIFQAIASGRVNKHIAEDLGISVRTVEKHRANAMRRLGLRNEAEIVRYAVRNGLVHL